MADKMVEISVRVTEKTHRELVRLIMFEGTQAIDQRIQWGLHPSCNQCHSVRQWHQVTHMGPDEARVLAAALTKAAEMSEQDGGDVRIDVEHAPGMGDFFRVVSVASSGNNFTTPTGFAYRAPKQ